MLLFGMIACKGPQIVTVPIHDSTAIHESETITDTPTWTDPESLLYQFAFECDSAYNVILKKYNELNTGVESEIEIKETIIYRGDGTKINRLEFDISVYVDSVEIQNRTIERLRKELFSQDVPIPVNVPVKFIPKYHKFTAWAFPGFVILLLATVYLKFKTKLLRGL